MMYNFLNIGEKNFSYLENRMYSVFIAVRFIAHLILLALAYRALSRCLKSSDNLVVS